MKIVVTVEEVLKKGIWSEVCERKGINIWASNESLIDNSQEIELTESEARELGLI